MAKLTQEQLSQMKPIVAENAGSATDKKIAALVLEKTGVAVTVNSVREARKALGIRKTRGRNSRVLAEGEVQVVKVKATATESVVDVV